MRRKKSKGFTLTELILTIGLLALLSAVAIPYFSDVGDFRVEGGAKKLVADISYARQLARSRSGTYGVSFDAAAESYTVFLLDPTTGTETAITDPTTQTSMTVDFDLIHGLQGIDILYPSFGGTTKVRFTSQGVPQNGVGVDLTAAGTVVLESEGKTRTISVQPNTGEVSGS